MTPQKKSYTFELITRAKIQAQNKKAAKIWFIFMLRTGQLDRYVRQVKND